MQEKRRYLELLRTLAVPEQLDHEFLYEVFTTVKSGMGAVADQNPVLADIGLNLADLSLYIANEHSFYLSTHPELAKDASYRRDEKYMSYLASVSLDKYYTNGRLAFQMGSVASRFHPALSTLDLYLNFILGMLSRYKQGEPERTLLVDIMNKGFQVSKCATSLLEGGYETEAFSTWRTLHENECILNVIVKYGEPVIAKYLRHMTYGVAFRGGIPSKEETDAIFAEIKEQMHAIGLKSKDMKRFIEYGWLLGVPNVMALEGFKFNFRDGVERVAGLSSYAKAYEMSSEVAHSSPLLIYSRKNYFFSITLLSLYESFFRLEKIFSTLYMSTVSEQEKNAYLNLRGLYYGELLACYEAEKNRFAALNKK